jgi:hypothetical protein
MFLIDVKGLYRKNPWLVKRKLARANLFYILAYVPEGAPNEFFVLSQTQANRLIAAELKRLKRPAVYPVTGFLWTLAQPYKGAWGVLPK